MRPLSTARPTLIIALAALALTACGQAAAPAGTAERATEGATAQAASDAPDGRAGESTAGASAETSPSAAATASRPAPTGSGAPAAQDDAQQSSSGSASSPAASAASAAAGAGGSQEAGGPTATTDRAGSEAAQPPAAPRSTAASADGPVASDKPATGPRAQQKAAAGASSEQDAPAAAQAESPIAARRAGVATTSPASTWWRPPAGVSWQIQYTGRTDITQPVDVYNLDWESTSAATVADLKARGIQAICYINAGGFEEWRSDAGRFPAAVLGQPLGDWAGERWLDTRQRATLMPIMTARMDACRGKGFAAIDPDNMDGYGATTGFPLTTSHSLAYQRELAAAAHARGLAIGLKNAIEILPAVSKDIDFAVNESCVDTGECGAYKPLLAANKPVFHVEYLGSPQSVCAAVPKGFSTVVKDESLNAPSSRCPR